MFFFLALHLTGNNALVLDVTEINSLLSQNRVGNLKDVSCTVVMLKIMTIAYKTKKKDVCLSLKKHKVGGILCFLVSRGIFNQGYLCPKCGLGAHKECLGQLGVCDRTGETDRLFFSILMPGHITSNI